MVNITMSVPESLFKRMKTHPELNWSAIARQSIEKRINDLDMLDKITAKSKMRMEDAVELGEKIKASAWNKLRKELA